MVLDAPDFYLLNSHMPDFTVSGDCADWLSKAEVQAYLDYYQINFGKIIPGVSHHMGKMDVEGYRISTHYWCPANVIGSVFIVHGYYDHVGVYQHIIRFLLENRFAVVMFDNPGHGLSSGERATIRSFNEYSLVLQHCINLCREVVPQPMHVVAQSTGGAIVLNYLHHRQIQNPFNKIVLLAPLVRSCGWTLSRLGFECIKWFADKLPRSFSVNSHDDNFLRFLSEKDPLQTRYLSLIWVEAKKQWVKTFHEFTTQDTAFLVIQGDEDKTVDWRYNTRVITHKFPNSQLEIITGARHQLVNESVPYREKVFCHMLNFLMSD